MSGTAAASYAAAALYTAATAKQTNFRMGWHGAAKQFQDLLVAIETKRDVEKKKRRQTREDHRRNQEHQELEDWFLE